MSDTSVQRQGWDNVLTVSSSGVTVPAGTLWDGTVKNLIYDTGTMEWVAQTSSGGGGGGDASAANQLTEISRLEDIRDELQGFFNPPATVDAVTASYPDSVTEVYAFKTGGTGGSTSMTLTVIYTDSTKNLIDSVERT